MSWGQLTREVMVAVVAAGEEGVAVRSLFLSFSQAGHEFNPQSVRSYLSRLKRDGTLEHHDGRYRQAKSQY